MKERVNVDLAHSHKGVQPHRHEYLNHDKDAPGVPPTKGKTYRMSMDAYNPGIYTEKPVKGNVVCVFCKGPVDDTSDPAYIAGVYMITPLGSSPMQPVEN